MFAVKYGSLRVGGFWIIIPYHYVLIFLEMCFIFNVRKKKWQFSLNEKKSTEKNINS